MSRRIPNSIKHMKQIRKLYDENITNTMNKNIKLAELTKMNEKLINADFTKKEKEKYNHLLDSVRDYNSSIKKNNDENDRLEELLEEELDKTGTLDFTKGGKRKKLKKHTRKKQKGGVPPRNRRSNRNRRNLLFRPASPDQSRNRTHEHQDDEFTTRLTDSFRRTDSFRPFSRNIQYISTPSESSDASDDNILPPLESVNSSESESEPEPENETLDNQYENLIQNYVSLVLDNLEVRQGSTINMIERAVRSFMTILNIINRDMPVENSMFETLENNLYNIMLPLSTPDRMNLSITLTQTSRRYIHNWEGNISEQQRNDLGRVLSLINRFRLRQLRNEYVVPDNTVRRPREVGGKKKTTRRRVKK